MCLFSITFIDHPAASSLGTKTASQHDPKTRYEATYAKELLCVNCGVNNMSKHFRSSLDTIRESCGGRGDVHSINWDQVIQAGEKRKT